MKSRIFRALLLIQILILPLCLLSITWASEDAVGFRTNVGHSGQNTMPDLVAPLGIKWDVPLPGVIKYPVVANGIVYIIVDGSTQTPPTSDAMYALNAGNGSIIWGPVTSISGSATSLVYDSGKLFVGASDPQGAVIQAIDSASGNQLWSYIYQASLPFPPFLTASNGEIYIQFDGILNSINETDGSIKWSVQFPSESDNGGIALSPTTLFMADGNILGIDRNTGDELWSPQNVLGSGSTAIYSDGFVFVLEFTNNNTQPFDTGVLDAGSGNLVEQFPPEGWPAIENGRIFTSTQKKVIARSLSDGNTLWATNGSDNHPPISAPTAVNGVVYVVGGENNFKGFDELTGNEVTNLPLSEKGNIEDGSIIPDIIAGDGILLIPIKELNNVQVENRLVAVGSAFPTANYSLTPATANGTNGWYTMPVNVTIKNGGSLFDYSVDGHDARTYFRPFTVSGDGKHVIKYWIANGNQGTPSYIYINIDGTAPVTTKSTAFNDRSTVTGPATITFNATDNLSGFLFTEYSLDNAAYVQFPPLTPSVSLPVSSFGKHTLAYRSVDFAGNIEAAHTINFQVTGILFTFSEGLQMFSSTQDESNIPLSQTFDGSTPTLAIWDPLNLKYDVTPTPPADSVAIGKGYWARFAKATNLIGAGDYADVTKSFKIPVHNGWNMIGSPWTSPYSIGGVHILESSGNIVDVTDPTSPISPNLYTYGPESTSYTTVMFGAEDFAFQPYVGYWLYSNQDCTLVFNPPGLENTPPPRF